MPKKPLFDDDIECPFCEKLIHMKVEKETINPAVPAETKLNVFVEKSTQTRLK